MSLLLLRAAMTTLSEAAYYIYLFNERIIVAFEQREAT